MLKVDRKFVDQLLEAVSGLESLKVNATDNARKELIDKLHIAMRLEASTIPPYLVAAWSIEDTTLPDHHNKEIRELILSVAQEEMLHMMGIANIISATGKIPDLFNPKMVLNWGKELLPIGGNLIPVLEPFSMDLLKTLFMEIEMPIVPQRFPVKKASFSRPTKQYATIGEFYKAIIKLINLFPEDPFQNGAAYHQADVKIDTRFDPIGHHPIEDFIVGNKKKAIEILDWIVDQGEGSEKGPFDGDGLPAHYYRFAEVYFGGRLIEDPNPLNPTGFAYDRRNQPLNCDFDRVRKFEPNPKMNSFDKDSKQYKGLRAFNTQYTFMFKRLHDFYSEGVEQDVRASINNMDNMKGFVNRLFDMKPAVCPSFEWYSADQVS